MATRTPGSARTDDAERAGEICGTCTFFPDCVHRRQQRTAVLHCELYEEGHWSVDLVAAIGRPTPRPAGRPDLDPRGHPGQVRLPARGRPAGGGRAHGPLAGRHLRRRDLLQAPSASSPGASTCARSAWAPPATCAARPGRRRGVRAGSSGSSPVDDHRRRRVHARDGQLPRRLRPRADRGRRRALLLQRRPARRSATILEQDPDRPRPRDAAPATSGSSRSRSAAPAATTA